MLALGLGLTAALLWAVHDLLARKFSQGAPLLPILVAGAGHGVRGASARRACRRRLARDDGRRPVGLRRRCPASDRDGHGAAFTRRSAWPRCALSRPICRGLSDAVRSASPWLQGREVTAADWLAVAGDLSSASPSSRYRRAAMRPKATPRRPPWPWAGPPCPPSASPPPSRWGKRPPAGRRPAGDPDRPRWSRWRWHPGASGPGTRARSARSAGTWPVLALMGALEPWRLGWSPPRAGLTGQNIASVASSLLRAC